MWFDSWVRSKSYIVWPSRIFCIQGTVPKQIGIPSMCSVRSLYPVISFCFLTRYSVLLTLQRLVRKHESNVNREAPQVPSPRHISTNSPAYREKHVPAEYRQAVKTLQAYRTDADPERTRYMEEHSTLNPKGLMVSVEQVSMFLQSNNTLVSFFEHSADVIEEPILKRLQSSETVLRQSGDASMVMHAIIDGIVDLAIPIATAYEDSIAELELDVLTEPSIAHSKAL